MAASRAAILAEHTRQGHAGSVLTMLPSWPDGTVTILVTSGQSPHAIPVSAAVRAGPRTILIALGSGRQSLARLRAEPAVALVVLAEGNIALSAYGAADVLEAPMPEGVLAVAIDVQSVQDHRREAFTVDAGARFHWTDEIAERRDDEVRAALRRIAQRR